MTKEGELHADEDRRRKEDVEVKNKADSMVYSVEKLRRKIVTRFQTAATPRTSNPPWMMPRKRSRKATFRRSTRPWTS